MVEGRISDKGVTVLPDETISESLPSSCSSSFADSCGETNRAVGRGPEDDGPLDFFKMGWAGGGLEALEDMLFSPLLSFAEDEALGTGIGEGSSSLPGSSWGMKDFSSEGGI